MPGRGRAPVDGLGRRAYDNPAAENFLLPPEREALARHRFGLQAEARMAVFSYIADFYKPLRRNRALGYRSSAVHEQKTASELAIETQLRQAP
ncbi:hypothetical protein GCM10007886_54670 [Methylobacterium gregans]|nr:hypothetical protein GCM10007886_54670 [Methylobacterium gregans]